MVRRADVDPHTRLDSVQLTTGVFNLLWRHGFQCVGSLEIATLEELRKTVRRFGPETQKSVIMYLKRLDLRLRKNNENLNSRIHEVFKGPHNLPVSYLVRLRSIDAIDTDRLEQRGITRYGRLTFPDARSILQRDLKFDQDKIRQIQAELRRFGLRFV